MGTSSISVICREGMKVILALAVTGALLAVVEGRRRGSGGSRGVSSWGGSRRVSSGIGKGSRRSSYGRKIAKAAVIGAGAYAGYKVAKAATKFATLPFKHTLGYEFDDWERWRNSDGFLCRNDNDCWISPGLECQDYELDFTPSAAWFGGDVVSIRGSCDCRDDFYFNGNDCLPNALTAVTAVESLTSDSLLPLWATILIVLFVAFPCCCCCAAFLIYKVFK